MFNSLKYEKIKKCGEYTIVMNRLSYKYGVMNSKNKLIIPCNYRDIDFNENHQNLFQVQDINALYGVVDINGKEIIPCKYDFIKITDFDFIEVSEQESVGYGVIDLNGQEVLPCIYFYVEVLSDSLINIEQKDGLDQVLNYKTNKVITKDYNYTSLITENLIKVKNQKNLYGLIDSNGYEITPCQYTFINYFYLHTNHETKETGLLIIRNEDFLYGIIDYNGKVIIPCQYDDIKCVEEGIIKVSTHQYGYFNASGDEIIPCKYSECKLELEEFKNKLIQAKKQLKETKEMQKILKKN